MSKIVFDDNFNVFPDTLSKRSIDLHRVVIGYVAHGMVLQGLRDSRRIHFIDQGAIVTIIVVGGFSKSVQVVEGYRNVAVAYAR